MGVWVAGIEFHGTKQRRLRFPCTPHQVTGEPERILRARHATIDLNRFGEGLFGKSKAALLEINAAHYKVGLGKAGKQLNRLLVMIKCSDKVVLGAALYTLVQFGLGF